MNRYSSRREFLTRLIGAASVPTNGRGTGVAFTFNGPQTAAALLPVRGRHGIEYVGSATSHFQAEPLLYNEQGQPSVASDWDVEVVRRVRGEHSRIPYADVTNLPIFLQRKEEYFDRSAELGENMFRFSFDFARLCPAKGQFNERLMAEYIKALLLIRVRGQEPFLTLHHFTMPRYLVQTDRNGNITAGAWENPEVTQQFRFYLANMIRFLIDEKSVVSILKTIDVSTEQRDAILHEGLVRYIMTINEPAVILVNGYLTGTAPPYKHSSFLALSRVLARLVEIHDIAREQLKQGLRTQSREPQVCVGHNWQLFDGFIGNVVHDFQVQWTDRFERDGKHSDFLALHYYFRRTIPLSASASRLRDYSDQPTLDRKSVV